MKLKWYLENTVKIFLILFFVSILIDAVSIIFGQMTLRYSVLWSLLFSFIITMADTFIYRLTPKKMSRDETDSLILKLTRSDYTETPEYNYANPSRVRYFKHNNFFACYKDVIIILDDDENTVYMSSLVLKEYE